MDFQTFYLGNRRFLLPVDVLPEGWTYMVVVSPMLSPTLETPRVAASIIGIYNNVSTALTASDISNNLHEYGHLEFATTHLARLDGQQMAASLPSHPAPIPSPSVSSPLPAAIPPFFSPQSHYSVSADTPTSFPSSQIFYAANPSTQSVSSSLLTPLLPPTPGTRPVPSATVTSSSYYPSGLTSPPSSGRDPGSLQVAAVNPSVVTVAIQPVDHSTVVLPHGTQYVTLLDNDHEILSQLQAHATALPSLDPILSTATPSLTSPILSVAPLPSSSRRSSSRHSPYPSSGPSRRSLSHSSTSPQPFLEASHHFQSTRVDLGSGHSSQYVASVRPIPHPESAASPSGSSSPEPAG